MGSSLQIQLLWCTRATRAFLGDRGVSQQSSLSCSHLSGWIQVGRFNRGCDLRHPDMVNIPLLLWLLEMTVMHILVILYHML